MSPILTWHAASSAAGKIISKRAVSTVKKVTIKNTNSYFSAKIPGEIIIYCKIIFNIHIKMIL